MRTTNDSDPNNICPPCHLADGCKPSALAGHLPVIVGFTALTIGGDAESQSLLARVTKAFAPETRSAIEARRIVEEILKYPKRFKEISDKKEYRAITVAVLRANGEALKHAAGSAKADKWLVIEAVKSKGSALLHASDELRANNDVVKMAVENDGLALQYASNELRANSDVVKMAVENDGLALQYASNELRANSDVVKMAVENDGLALQYASPGLQAEKDVVMAAVLQTGLALEHASPGLQAEKDVVMAAVRQDGLALQHASPELQADIAVVLEAVKLNGSALQHASPELKADRAVVLEAVKLNGSALQHASNALRADRAVVLAAVLQNGLALEHASTELKADRAVVLEAVKLNGSALQHASPELKADRAVVLAAVLQNGLALEHASTELKADRAVVLAAAKQNAKALQYAPRERKSDPDVFLAAARQDTLTAIQHVDPNLLASDHLGKFWKDNEDFVLAAFQRNPHALKHASKDIVLAAVQANGLALKYASAQLRGDPEVVYAAWKNNPLSISLAERDAVLKLLRTQAKHNKDFARDAVKQHKYDKEVVLAAVQANGLALKYASAQLRGDPNVVLATMRQNIVAIKYILPEHMREEDLKAIVLKEIVKTLLLMGDKPRARAFEEIFGLPRGRLTGERLQKDDGQPTSADEKKGTLPYQLEQIREAVDRESLRQRLTEILAHRDYVGSRCTEIKNSESGEYFFCCFLCCSAAELYFPFNKYIGYANFVKTDPGTCVTALQLHLGAAVILQSCEPTDARLRWFDKLLLIASVGACAAATQTVLPALIATLSNVLPPAAAPTLNQCAAAIAATACGVSGNDTAEAAALSAACHLLTVPICWDSEFKGEDEAEKKNLMELAKWIQETPNPNMPLVAPASLKMHLR